MCRSFRLAGAIVLAFGSHSEAQIVPRTMTCNDAAARAVTAVEVMNGTIAKAAIDRNGLPIVQYDPRKVEGISSQEQLFVYAHECGHHALGHDSRGATFTSPQEQEADCYGIRSLIGKLGFTSDDVTLLQMEMRALEASTSRHFPWRARVYDLEGCLPEVLSRRQAAARGNEPSADECIVHNDGENAILNKTRDGRAIEGTYMVRNTCARAVRCAFTIEVGTLLESDVDVGSWRSFRAQKTITEQHIMQSAAAPDTRGATEFRFRAAVDTVPAGEAVDFRVLTACQY